jgi:hypothetical protein
LCISVIAMKPTIKPIKKYGSSEFFVGRNKRLPDAISSLKT